MVLSSGFDAVADKKARVLILGSLPGRVSLEMRQYYAQPRNFFWRLMGQQFNFSADLPYQSRIAALKRNRVALWDVCASAYRPGSMDSSIDSATVIPNDFLPFLLKYNNISVVFFNGGKAAALYRQLVIPNLPRDMRSLSYKPLPSSSPAHAAMPFDEKLIRWSSVRRAAATRSA
jgi:double-stranded uracil-DNA glycosylase